MLKTIENQNLIISIETLGAELKSIKSKITGAEYLWCGDKTVWGKTAPNLFPCIGNIKRGFIEYEGKRYNMTKHGFARDCEFTVCSQTRDAITFRLTESKETLEIYPFRFVFDITFSLTGHTLEVRHDVQNSSSDTLYFALGGHTAFSTEVSGETMESYYLEFDRKCEFVTELFDEPAGLLSGGKAILGRGRVIDLNKELFDKDALIFEDIKSKSVRLKNRRSGSFVMIDYEDFSNLAVWSPKNCERFVCIEPWICMTDRVDGSHNLKEKRGIAALPKGQKTKASYSITVIE